MSTTKKSVVKKKAPTPKLTKKRSVGRPRKPAPILVNKTLVTIHRDGIITVEKTEETVTEQVMSKAEAN